MTYTWDNNGNLLNDGTRTFTYDQANRATQIISGTNTYAFAYNGLSDRITQTVNSVLTRYTLDPSAGLTQVLSDGTSTYLYGVGRIAQQQTNMQYFGADGLGSVRQLYNSSGQIIANHRYDPFGNIISQSGVGTSNYGFTGEWTDATGLEYLRARYYAPTQGRFVTKDVWEGDYWRPLSLNRWNYVQDNPTQFTDPSGMVPSCTPCGPLPPLIPPPAPPPPQALASEPGAGPFHSEEPNPFDYAYRAILYGVATGGEWTGMPDAARHMRHFLGASGKPLIVEPDRMVNDISNFQSAVQHAKNLLKEQIRSDLPFGGFVVEEGVSSSIPSILLAAGTGLSCRWIRITAEIGGGRWAASGTPSQQQLP